MSVLGNRLFVLAQYLVPQHLLSQLTGYVARNRVHWFKTRLINAFIARYGVDMRAARGETAEDYENFNAFFTRRLKVHLRPIATRPQDIASPADGTVGQFGTLESDTLVQAKGHKYSLQDLLGGDTERALPFINGEYATIYLSPRDYHRVHMPLTGTLREMVYIPGKLFSVNSVTTGAVPRLFARNERVVCRFDTEQGPLAIVLVGAMIVSSIHTVWHGLVSPHADMIQTFTYLETDNTAIRLNKGDELGHFMLGSTVIMLFGANQMQWDKALLSGQSINFGEAMATSLI
ncbi:archaetidylserine decarboxylase [Enterobacter hormaechei]|uniref:archaetidylserine decarboxylase n=1 Tax=Enterobacter cloacae complex TaxID=354276 RepID=UPI001EEAC58B|nr:archaetidylserine decarboxylase [Enterobacter hormaechei]MDV5251708.1 archaetidylserine decarboxylase [Enterobacter hormaechei]MDV5400594.1 archaetidylserine decarboxylase [Enterobacter hormaechei]MDV5617182.1 archaetidylserine decarboxylase [Enterobacter hormaechei]UJA60591.1 archaetidylserine decarboxylase [Enterobacter hormaechei]